MSSAGPTSPDPSSTRTDTTRCDDVARKSSMCGCRNTGTAPSPVRSVRYTVSSSSPRCSRKNSAGSVRKLCSIVVAGPPPTPSTSAIRTVYSVSSHSGSAKRTPTLRPEVSTRKGVAGVIVTCSGSTSRSACDVVRMRRAPDAAAAAAGSTCTSVKRGPCAVLTAAPARPTAASRTTTPANARPNARPRRRRDPRATRRTGRRCVLSLAGRGRARRVGASVLIGVTRLVDALDAVGLDRESPIGRRVHRAGDAHPLAGIGGLSPVWTGMLADCASMTQWVITRRVRSKLPSPGVTKPVSVTGSPSYASGFVDVANTVAHSPTPNSAVSPVAARVTASAPANSGGARCRATSRARPTATRAA